MTDYPNREHENADQAARRRALKALSDIEFEVATLRRRIERGAADGDDMLVLAERTREVTAQLATLAALRDVREWHAADVADTRHITTADAAEALGISPDALRRAAVEAQREEQGS